MLSDSCCGRTHRTALPVLLSFASHITPFFGELDGPIPAPGHASRTPDRCNVSGPLADMARQPGAALSSGAADSRYSAAWARKSSRLTNSSAARCVDFRITGGATPAAKASAHRLIHRHQRSPGFSPGKR